MIPILKAIGTWLLHAFLEWGYKKGTRAFKEWRARRRAERKWKAKNAAVEEKTKAANTEEERNEAAKDTINTF